MTEENLNTKNENTWCPGCSNFFILETVKRTLTRLIEQGDKQEDFAMVTGIGCHAKIFDYLNISGIYGLHGRVIPTAMGIKIGNPKLKVLGFAGDGDTYAEGMAHFIHAFRYNTDMTLIVHDNQSFSLTTGQSTPTSMKGFKNKVTPDGEFNQPFNPIKLALGAGATFIARCNVKDIEHTSEILEKAIQHKGFSYVEMVQPCKIFNPMPNMDRLMYKIQDNSEKAEAENLADQWDYNSEEGKIPIGIIYRTKKPTFQEKLL